jgi:hypothetical protein
MLVISGTPALNSRIEPIEFSFISLKLTSNLDDVNCDSSFEEPESIAERNTESIDRES